MNILFLVLLFVVFLVKYRFIMSKISFVKRVVSVDRVLKVVFGVFFYRVYISMVVKGIFVMFLMIGCVFSLDNNSLVVLVLFWKYFSI